MSTPVYGKQYVRFAETLVFDDQEALQFRLVQDTGIAAASTPTGVYATTIAAGEVVGVNQFSIPALATADAVEIDAEPQSSRLGMVANSGLLLIEADATNTPTVGTAIEATPEGLATDGNGGTDVAITYAGGDLLVREVLSIGGTPFVLVHFV